MLAPAAPPAGMVLASASVTEEDAEEETCASVELDYQAEPDDAGADGDDGGWPTYLRVISQPASCAWDTPEDMSFASGPWRGVEVGAHRGELREVPASEAGFDEGMVELRMTIGDVLVWAEGNLPADRLIAALASMAPLDISTQPVERSEPPARP